MRVIGAGVYLLVGDFSPVQRQSTSRATRGVEQNKARKFETETSLQRAE